MSRVILLGKYVTRGAKNQFCFEAEIIKDWYIVVDLAVFDNKAKHQTKLLDVDVVVTCMSLPNVSVRRNDTGGNLDTCLKFGLFGSVWGNRFTKSLIFLKLTMQTNIRSRAVLKLLMCFVCEQ